MIVILAATVARFRPCGPKCVDVNFITEPFEAEIYLDGKRAVDASGNPYTTPCTIPGVPSGVHQVVFKKSGLEDLSIANVDFAHKREVLGRWKARQATKPFHDPAK